MKQIDDSIWEIKELLSSSECLSIITEAKSNGFSIAKMQHLGRNNRETLLKSSTIIQKLCVRLADEIYKEESIAFQILCLNRILEIYQYQPGDFIVPHCDGPQEIEPSVLSSYTLVIYLNDSILGGDTVFPKRGIKISPQQGKAVLFKHSILHESIKVLEGTKYIARTDVAISNFNQTSKQQNPID